MLKVNYDEAVERLQFYHTEQGIVAAVPLADLMALAEEDQKQGKTMSPMEAWKNISRRLAELDLRDGYDNDDIMAQCIAFKALREMEARNETD